MNKIVYGFLLAMLTGCTHFTSNKVLSDKHYCHIIEKTINLESFQQYYHIDEFPTRSPLSIDVGDLNVNCPDLEKFGQSVDIVKTDRTKKTREQHLVIEYIEPINNTAKVLFYYPPEAVRGEVHMKKQFFQWIVINEHLSEF